MKFRVLYQVEGAKPGTIVSGQIIVKPNTNIHSTVPQVVECFLVYFVEGNWRIAQLINFEPT